MGYRTGEARSIPHFPNFSTFNCVTPINIILSHLELEKTEKIIICLFVCNQAK
jgi:hypothetical protein